MFRVIRKTPRFLSHFPVSRRRLVTGFAFCLLAAGPLGLPLAAPLISAEVPAAGETADEAGGPQPLSLATRQQQVAERFQRLEQLLIRLAEVEATENPERSALLRRAAKQSRESFILDRLSAASDALSGSQYQQAIDAQQSANENLAALLKLLLTEDRSERIRNEKERISNWIKDLKREERKQRAARARTENGADLDAIAEEQREILEKAAELREEMGEGDEPTEGSQAPAKTEPAEDGSQSEGNSGKESPPQDAQGQPSKSQNQPSAVEQAEQERDEADKRLAEAKQKAEAAEKDPQASEAERSEAAEKLKQAEEAREAKEKALAEAQQQQAASESESPAPPPSGSDSPPSESQPSQSEQQPGQPQQPQSPQQEAEKKLQSAIERMKQAQQQLEQAKREEATDRQRDAEKNLREAIDQLEKILRQLREEEMQRELARLEARLRKMAQMQSDVLDATRELAVVPADARDRQTDLRAGNLAEQEKKIVLEADRAMLLLREEGSSVAFPEVVQQIRGDMRTVADRLAQTKIDGITQGIQEDVLAALEEMIAALQKAQRDLEKQKQQQTPPQQGSQPGEQPLVESLAELKLIRTMQERIKGTTDRYSEMVEQADEPLDQDFLGLLQNLADRQSRLSTITRDIVLERNR